MFPLATRRQINMHVFLSPHYHSCHLRSFPIPLHATIAFLVQTVHLKCEGRLALPILRFLEVLFACFEFDRLHVFYLPNSQVSRRIFL